MRAAIRQKLISDIPDIQGRCYEPQAAGADTQKPYLIIRQGVDSEDSLWTGFRRIIEVWPYVARTTFQKVDDLADKVVESLDKQLITDTQAGEAFSCQYLGTVGQDYVDEDWDVITRGLRFAVLALQPVDIVDSTPPDPYIETLAAWTGSQYPDWHVYRQLWPLGYEKPAVMWRISNERYEAVNAHNSWRYADIVGHVVSAAHGEQNAMVFELAKALQLAVKISGDGGHLTVLDVRSDLRVDGFRQGQIRLTLRGIAKPVEEAGVLMQEVQTNGQWR
ncbi:hypothetical protein [Mahella australiensis]|uniref:Uncharacterized protein n=1 Tax=Mahella australiensis (strain DSM 15567 / CIP 107919 / 50-1 BON) TaxID=697281 RepID=F3ZZH2_MAHA5|nr:hypothetical protein [Mahella australiensis]AEE95782.1 hypothetical protein Mahau_0579 [Mahella australiensis 50-1 BON]